jgi:hypothetical protein
MLYVVCVVLFIWLMLLSQDMAPKCEVHAVSRRRREKSSGYYLGLVLTTKQLRAP